MTESLAYKAIFHLPIISVYRTFAFIFTSLPLETCWKPPMEVSYLQTPILAGSPIEQNTAYTTMDDVDDMDIDLGPVDDGEATQLVCMPQVPFESVILTLMSRSLVSPLLQPHKAKTMLATKLSRLALIPTT